VSFDVRAREITSGFLANTPDNRESGVKGNRKYLARRGDQLRRRALEYLNNDSSFQAANSFFLLSDGVLTWGNDRLTILSEAFAGVWEKNWFTYAFGDETINRNLFTQLTQNGGQLIRVPNSALVILVRLRRLTAKAQLFWKTVTLSRGAVPS
jgi:hypothetical protein